MEDKSLRESMRKSAQRHIFSRYRIHMRFFATLVYLSFSAVDYLYSKENFLKWFGYRLIFVGFVFVYFYFLARSKKMRNNIEIGAVTTLVLSCELINIMIYQSGGYSSLYITGLILCVTTGIQIFRLNKNYALTAQLLSYAPTIVIMFSTAPIEKLNIAFIQSGFLAGMIVLSYIYGSSEDQVQGLWAKFRKISKAELDRHRKSDILKRHFPKILRDSFEKNPNLAKGKKVMPNAVVGFADIVSSSAIANAVPLAIDWELKERFLEAATKRAMENEMVVLTHLGDGVLFLANYNENSAWYHNLISFYEGLVRDYKQIADDLNITSLEYNHGVKFGVSNGPAMVGFLGKDQSYFTAIGPDVNLAARLCAQAQTNQIVVSSRIWHSMKSILIGWNFENHTYDSLKGFSYPVSAVHISPRSLGNADGSMECADCGSSMSLMKTEDGFLDYRCVNGHNKPKLANKKLAA